MALRLLRLQNTRITCSLVSNLTKIARLSKLLETIRFLAYYLQALSFQSFINFYIIIITFTLLYPYTSSKKGCEGDQRYLSAVSFHDQRPSAASTCSNTGTRHVTVHRNLPRVHLEKVSFVSLRPDKKYNLAAAFKTRQ